MSGLTGLGALPRLLVALFNLIVIFKAGLSQHSSPSLHNKTLGSGTHLLTVPLRAIPGFNFTLTFDYLDHYNFSIYAYVFELKRPNYAMYNFRCHNHLPSQIVNTSAQLVGSGRVTLDLPIPKDLRRRRADGGIYYYQVSCAPGSAMCPISECIAYELPLVDIVTTIFVQTDKAIYKPGQMVHFRVFAVYPDLQMFNGNFTVEVKDPNGNKIQVLQEVEGRNGVLESSLGLADQPVFGDWSIIVEIQMETNNATTTETDRFTKTFTVAEYQLPRYEVKVELPPYLLTDDSEMKGTVKATYTFGQPVSGMVELHVMSASARPDYCGNEPRHVELAFRIDDGEAKFTIPRDDIRRVISIYSGMQLKVTAYVKEDLTDVTLHGSSEVTYHSSPYKIQFLDNTPSVFKPGLPFSIYVQGTMIDGSPILDNKNNITTYVTCHYIMPMSADESYLYGRAFTGTYPLPIVETKTSPTGVAKLDLHIPTNSTRLDVTVSFNGLTTHKTISQMFSMSGNYLQLMLLDQNIKSGHLTRMEARATEPMTHLRYQIICRGVVHDSQVIDAKGQHVMTLNLTLTPAMAPTCHMMAYYVRPDWEIVPDSIAFNIDGVFENEVTLSMSANKSEPHADLDVTITADPGSVVNLLAVDQSVLLMKGGNDVSVEEVSAAVQKYDMGQKPSSPDFALNLGCVTAYCTLNNVGVKVYTDGDLTLRNKPNPTSTKYDPSIYGPDIFSHDVTPMKGHYHTDVPLIGQTWGYMGLETPSAYPLGYTGEIPTAFPPAYTGVTPTAFPPGYMGETPTALPPGYTGETPTAFPPGYTGAMPTAFPSVIEQGSKPLKEVERIRSFFPETWLWLNTTVGASGKVSIHTTVPDTITSWVTTAFATNTRTGLGVAPSAARLTVFRSFFVSLTMPSSVVRGEHVVLQASVFNYLAQNLTVVVSLPGSKDYTGISIAHDGSETLSTGDVEHTIVVKSQEQEAVFFPVIPSTVGSVNIEVSARSSMAADAVRRLLTVQAEGVPSEFSIPVFINLAPNGSDVFKETFPISLPDDVIDGSKRIRVKVTGDILGPSIDGLENLLRMPTGCGEQNIIKLAPDVYIAQYLTASGQMTSVTRTNVENLINTGYQRELTYQRTDGSFSAFGEVDGTGSTWLTALVLRVFHEARPYVYVDNGVLQRSLDWIIKRQNTDGSFNEFGRIYDPWMKPFKEHSSGLTSVVLISLLENVDVPTSKEQQDDLHNAITNATDFLESEVDQIPTNDSLTLALTSLALTRVASSQADLAFDKLMARATNEHGMTFWKMPSTPSKLDPYRRWRPSHVRARPIDIQVTSYALLTLVARGMFEEGMSVLHWLTRQRNPYGGFASTQDTIVGLQAMTQFVTQAAPSGFDLHLDVHAQSLDANFDVTPVNAVTLQMKDHDFVPTDVTFSATGKGVAIAELDVFFNSESDPGDQAFDVSTVLLDDYINSFKLMICTRYRLPGESGMVVQEVGIPSGFAPDMTSINKVAGIKRTERRGNYLDIYFDKVTKNSLCYTVMFDRQAMVAHTQPSYVITQEYYEPSYRATTSYVSLSLENSEICDVCDHCCGNH